MGNTRYQLTDTNHEMCIRDRPGAVGWTVGQGRTALRGLGPGKWLPLKKQPHEQLQEPLKAVGMSACEPPSPLRCV